NRGFPAPATLVNNGDLPREEKCRDRPVTNRIWRKALQKVSHPGKSVFSVATTMESEQSLQRGPFMQWGKWKLDPQSRELVHTDTLYSIALDDIHSSAAMLDWIFQIQGKAWCDPQTMSDLLAAFRAILQPQANYCSTENDVRPDAKALVHAFLN